MRRLVMLLGVLASAPAGAQTMYRGYDIGPDFGAMLEQSQRGSAQLSAQMQAAQQQAIARAMQDPECQAHYRAFLQRGGQMPFPNFAYQCAATANFSPEGMRRYREGEVRNQREEQLRRDELRRAEEARGRAQGEYAERYREGQREQGRVMQGQSTYVDPRTGQPVVLPYMGPNGYVDPSTGQRFTRDQQGNQYVMLPNGQWQMLYPAR
ncbi:hypothetical protein [Plastoroseomonas arctica]|uniref:DUF2799 domain-containing protein n=1 Tax=Plastoroseomonas arctica TaxID=1509237 RepID=A0AAF1JYM3_9PROT|nr:hypothetical protein [Plastoroseomonas arctica]MBR0655028.1 hypothetical protein [Plastoroseomonas arctica]